MGGRGRGRRERRENKECFASKVIKRYIYGPSQKMFSGAFSFLVFIRIGALWKNNALPKFYLY